MASRSLRSRGRVSLFFGWLLVGVVAGTLWLGRPALAADPTSGRTVTVDMVDIEFRPARIRLDPGDRIRFINKDPFGHSVFIVNAADPNMVVVPDTKVAGNASYTTEPIDRKGVFILYCTIHGGMKGLVSTTGSFKITGE